MAETANPISPSAPMNVRSTPVAVRTAPLNAPHAPAALLADCDAAPSALLAAAPTPSRDFSTFWAPEVSPSVLILTMDSLSAMSAAAR